MTAHERRVSGSVARRPADLHPDRLLLAAERGVDIGARILRQGRSHIGALIAKGDRDFATNVDLQIESAIKASLANAAPSVPFLGEEGGGDSAVGAFWVLDPIDGTINFSRDSPLRTISLALVVDGQPVLGIVDAPLLGRRRPDARDSHPPIPHLP